MISSERLMQLAEWSKELHPDHFEFARKNIVEREYSLGAYICRRGELFDYWAGVISGFVKAAAITSEGTSIGQTAVAPGGWFGESTALRGIIRPYDVVAIGPTRLVLMPAQSYRWLLNNSHPFSKFVAAYSGERILVLMRTITSDRLLEPIGKVALTLMMLFNPILHPRVGNRLDIGQHELGQLAGLSRQVTGKAVHDLAALGLITSGRSFIAVPDLAALTQYVDDANLGK